MLTCKDFLHELSEYLDETIDAELRAKLEKHITECPNCWVIADTTRKTIKSGKVTAPMAVKAPKGIAQVAKAKHEPTHDEIAVRAYELYLDRGGLQGHHEEDWLRAESELRAG